MKKILVLVLCLIIEFFRGDKSKKWLQIGMLLPLIAFGVCRIFSLDTIMLPMLFVACMPCGLNTVIFPKFVGEDTSTGARLAFLSHFISCATIPFWLFLII